ncbi:bifunctional hydroxymethylpyrimidine kinase/phosphomethylpyrimidine kinase [Bacillus pseudomycoides]|uniref:bifunctional hydroxymethylpyrimidine kinase/phosphomethylpyrimidine kinase n=1 Tax=Bacillus pseudomycoides TaxID=64104 RepID=UPI000BED268E|nr:bifunctional hydroxymethylpyrimidine kinase/phosphomethylpyrimidine kinase [Bacillus pseudomycoides]PED07329.1 bifunctional hydroxymethylpyrimidine kinase/phosphomethylpyrimidine kinase [Bacillus pseudomycoides]PEI92633.1 bifunctional hydroxymethylpyrimidine kinase/phosphomethylpyrimidine kinase [Bacillus pseudomycoides]PEK13591.1 bifunctional hydroxymethylpyrimidine kinase/phosphomethylpyrimidine kinase [Bacillus pseudomycoides]PEM63392.1 bifunctional hydroxymethylpyrimidine kinase/phosphom
MSEMKVNKALTIAGSDSGGGAGIQADLKTFQELGVYGMTAITAITAQNTLGVQGVYPVTLEGIQEQLNSIGADLTPDAVKLGMLFSSEIIKVVAENIKKFGWNNIVLDPVMIAKGGASLLQQEAVQALKEHLLPIATVVTPNVPEAEVLTGMEIHNIQDSKEAAKELHRLGAKYVLMKGGHADYQGNEVIDFLFDGEQFIEYKSERIDSKQTHGSGCTFASAVTAGLANGYPIEEAVREAKKFISIAIEQQLNIGSGHGPTNHFAYKVKL